jgi:excisionase family DNA binding protein
MTAREPLLDARGAAELLGVHLRTLQQWAQQGRVPCLKVGSRLRFRRAELEAWAEGRGVKHAQTAKASGDQAVRGL